VANLNALLGCTARIALLPHEHVYIILRVIGDFILCIDIELRVYLVAHVVLLWVLEEWLDKVGAQLLTDAHLDFLGAPQHILVLLQVVPCDGQVVIFVLNPQMLPHAVFDQTTLDLILCLDVLLGHLL